MAAGKGSRFTDLTANKEKCLLPVGNLPMIWYILNTLQRIGFKEVIVIVHDNVKSEVAAIPKKHGLKLELDLCTVSPKEDLGTAESLRLVHKKLVSDRIMVLSSDLITDVQIHNLTDLHLVKGSSVTALFSKTGLDPKNIPVPGPKTKHKKGKYNETVDAAFNSMVS